MNKNKKVIILLIAFAFTAAIIVIISLVPRTILKDKPMIKLTITDGTTGNTYETTKKEEIERCLEFFQSHKVKRAIHIPFTGGWEYRIDITYEDASNDKLVIESSNKIEINASTYKLYGNNKFPDFEEISNYITK